ncbi:MAG TPA: DNA-processing protein DprA [Bacteroidales bacterium]|nr:DNA-processing protein DprA [Bacteroidales bacterium]
MNNQELLYGLALAKMPGIGDISAKKLVEYFGKVQDIFTESYRNLLKIPGIGTRMATYIIDHRNLEIARKELDFIHKHDIKVSFYLDDDYPQRLKECPDSPIIIFYKGNIHATARKIISIVGTRNITRHGKETTTRIISRLAENHPDAVVVSGLAYGVDIAAHKAALKYDIPTIGVLAHGFNTLYPSVHIQVARDMLARGALITDFTSEVIPDRNNFLKRNRIIAGYSDATLVIESGIKGGAMVTADIAASYNRDVFAVPGFPGEKYSEGCNMLIKSQKAYLIESAEDIEYFMDWRTDLKPEIKQKTISFSLSPIESEIMDQLVKNKQMSVEELSSITGKPVYQISPVLLRLEFSGLIANLPGNIYRSLT